MVEYRFQEILFGVEKNGPFEKLLTVYTADLETTQWKFYTTGATVACQPVRSNLQHANIPPSKPDVRLLVNFDACVYS
jgi:hypothetical protein